MQLFIKTVTLKTIPLIAVILSLASLVSSDALTVVELSEADLLNLKLTVAVSEVRRQALLNDTAFVFDFFKLANVSTAAGVTTGKGGSTVAATASNFPALIGHGVAMTVGFIDACGINLPHTHPRATEINFIIKGSFQAGFFQENGARYIQNNISEGMATVFPQGAIHFEQNLGCTPAMFVAAFNNVDPGVQTTTLTYFGLPNDIAGVGIGQNAKEVRKIVRDLVKNPAIGVAECRKRCKL